MADNWSDILRRRTNRSLKISIIDASHFDPQIAYAAINTLRLDDLNPHIPSHSRWRKTWTEIVNGIPNGENVQRCRGRS